jgi:hypothetical protein
MVIRSLPDITGTGSPIPLVATPGTRARRIFLTALSAVARFGDASITATRGVELPVGVEVTISCSDADMTDLIDLSTACVLQSGGTVSASFAA